MPRLKEEKMDPRKVAVLQEIGGQMAACGMNKSQLARLTGMPCSSLTDRLRHIENLRLSEYWKIQDVLEREMRRRA